MLKQEDKKQNASCNQVILDHFWNICGQSDEKRYRSVKIIHKIISKQVADKQYDDLFYCINRLIRGLTSNSEFSRRGFCLLFYFLLKYFPEPITLPKLIEFAEKEYGKFKEDCNPETAIAWTFFFSCLLKSERIDHNVEEEILSKIFQILFTLGCKKNYLELYVCNLMRLFFNLIKEDNAKFKIIANKLESMNEFGNTIFKNYLMLVIYQINPELYKKQIHQNVLNLTSNGYTNIIKQIKETTKYSPINHPINELLIQTIKNIDPKNLKQFYSKLIEEIFQCDLRKTSLGFKLIPILINNANDVPVSIINHLK